MRTIFFFSLSLVAHLKYAVCLPSSHLEKVPISNGIAEADTCVPISPVVDSVESLLAKAKALPGICPSEDLYYAQSTVLQKRQAGGTVEDYSCDENRPCKNGACCAKTGFCGYGPDSCGDGTSPNDHCWSQCDAKAECGRYAKTPGQECPLKVCCSQFGFCGTTAEFCAKTNNANTTCQSNCDQPGSGSSGGDVQSRIIGYYEARNWQKNCIGMQLKDIPVSSITHLHYSFAYVAPSSYAITTMDDTVPTELFAQFAGLKKQNPALKVIVSIGGWTFNDNGTITQPVFGDIASSSGNRAKFIDSLLSFMTNYGFDGVDFDWEYPGAGDRGGHDDDGVNYTQLLSDLRARFSGVISFTAPTSYWYLRHFDLFAMTKHVDWINVMSYDLHGTWDSSNPIGNHVLAHTNLTEIKLALDLYWRNSIPANKLNLGLGFYGRSFQLSDPGCSMPGCLFKGGASPGPCTQNSGTLSYREIMDVISTNGLTPYYDKTNQVKYVTWGGDQWVSYDDQETFQAKIKLANEMGLGGVLIWSLDQDTAQLDALAGVIYPKSLGAIGAAAEGADNWEQAGGGDCRVTDCGTTGCRTGEVLMFTQQCDGKGHQSSICCPFSSAPDAKTCSWRGGYPFCNGQCHPGEVALASSFWGDGKKCKDGRKFYCCPATRELPACRWTDCGESCSSDENKLTWAEESCWDDEQSFCCKKTQDWQNCQWYGKGGSCFDDHCPTGHSVSLSTSYEGEGTDCGIHFERQRSFCCDPPAGQSPFSPVPLEYLFPNPPTGPGVDSKFDLKLDPTYGGSSPLKFGDDPNDAEFGFVVLASPETIQVSLNARDGSHWEVFDCFDDKSEEAQTVRMMCTDHTETSTCDKIHLGHGAAGTIVEMPKGCGPGKYAVVKEMRESRNQGLPKHLVKRGLLQSKIFDLTFDYDFSRVPRDLGNTQMRIDYSNEPGYWDKIVNKTATKRKRSLDTLDGNHRRWLEDAWREDLADHRRGVLPYDELHKRWFGSDIISWLQGLINGVTDIPIVSNGYTDDFTVILLNEVVQGCPIGPAGTTVSGKLDVRASTHVELHTSFGFTLITTLSNSGHVSFKDSYLYFNNRGKVSAKFTADAVATAQFDSGDKTLVSADQFGAAFAVPGIVTIGPNFKLVGQVKGQLTLGAYFEANVNLADWNIRQTYPDQGPDWDPKAPQTPNRDGTQELLTPEWMYGVSASGFVELHVKPTITFGIDFNKNFINTDGASVNLVADGWIRFHADANHGGGSGAPSSSTFCYGVDAGADLYASIKAPSFNGWTLAKSPLPIASSDPIQIIPTTCPITSRGLHELSELDENIYSRREIASSSSSADLFDIRDGHRAPNGLLEKRAQTYGPIIRLGIQCPVGNNGGGTSPGPCPLCDTTAISRRATDDSCVLVLGRPDESTCESNIMDARDLDALGVEWGAENISQIDHQLWKRGSKTGTWLLDPGNPASAQTVSFNPYPECNKQNTNGITKWFGFDEQGMSTPNCPTDVSKFTSAQVDTSTYQTDHIFEAQTVLHFFDFLRGGGQFNLPIRLPNGYTAATSAWVNDVLLNAATGSFAVQNLGGYSVLELISNNVLGDSTSAGRGRMALLYKGINNDKGHFFKFENLGTLDVTGKVRASKIIQRNTAGVFGYLRRQEIAPKFQASGQAFENALALFDAAYAWGSHVGAEPGRPAGANRGLRDLWAYWIDVYLATIEARAGTWAGQARTAMQGLSTSATDEAANWVTSFFGPGGAGNVLQFAQPNPGSQVGPSGVAVPNSRYGMWTTASGPWT
ncbi:putative glycoside hydrolase family 18 protein [Rosellinia necatrix]|uniref:chitinase n=1 Tax=Rosellinia necatrix TaxID=77044 RepID=A0A1W2TQA8_ROSNE|nr:putative glycoside hydrolase family 18 protein [Rosellinia necatrix]